MRKPELRPVTESSRAETVALLLGEDLRGKQGQGNHYRETRERFLFSEL